MDRLDREPQLTRYHKHLLKQWTVEEKHKIVAALRAALQRILPHTKGTSTVEEPVPVQVHYVVWACTMHHSQNRKRETTRETTQKHIKTETMHFIAGRTGRLQVQDPRP